MPKTVQLKSGNDNIYVSSIIKQVARLNIKAGQTYSDELIKKARQVVVYYSVSGNQYSKSAIIPKTISDWFWDIETTNGYVIYFLINWDLGAITVSQYSTQNDNVCVQGYDLIA